MNRCNDLRSHNTSVLRPHHTAVSRNENFGLSQEFMRSFNDLLDHGDRDGARRLLNHQIKIALDLLDEISRFQRSLDEEP